jgi:hypothetical protein
MPPFVKHPQSGRLTPKVWVTAADILIGKFCTTLELLGAHHVSLAGPQDNLSQRISRVLASL